MPHCCKIQLGRLQLEAAALARFAAPLATQAESALIRQRAGEFAQLPGAGGQLPIQLAVAGAESIPHQLEPLALDTSTAEQRAWLVIAQGEIAQIELPAGQRQGQGIVEGEHLELVKRQLADIDLLRAPALPILPPTLRQADIHAA